MSSHKLFNNMQLTVDLESSVTTYVMMFKYSFSGLWQDWFHWVRHSRPKIVKVYNYRQPWIQIGLI